MILWMILFTTTAWAKEISVLSLNLHGLHPMGEERRVIVKADGTKQLSTSQLHYFNETEILRGYSKRQALLASHFRSVRPDIIFLQEVAGAEFNLPKTCPDFMRSNSASDLKFRLPDYQVYPACRGNVGWWSDINTFKNFKIVREKSQTVAVDQGSNPFPAGMIVEGLSFLTAPSIKVLNHVKEKLAINSNNETFFFHLLKFSLAQKNDGQWWLAVNIHGAYNLKNFEEAITTRRYLSKFINQQPDNDKFQGFIVAGDFNADLPQKEISTLPWSFFHAWQTPQGVKEQLIKQNPSESRTRIDKSVQDLFDWFSWPRHQQDGSLNEVTLASPCLMGPMLMNPFCQMKEKIDHIFVSGKITAKKHSALYHQNNWTDLDQTLSDHPGIMATLELAP